MDPAAKGGEKKKGHSAIGEALTREYTVHTHKRIHGEGFQERAPQVLRETRRLAVKAVGTPDVHTDTRSNKAIRA